MTRGAVESSLIEDVAAIVRKAAKVPARVPIAAESRLVEDLGIDSLDLVGVVLQIQDEFDIVIDEAAVPNLCRIADLAACLAAKGDSATVSGPPARSSGRECAF